MPPLRPNRQYGDYAEIAALIQATLEPLVSKVSSVENKVDRLEGKVDAISQDRATRSDLEKMRQELQVGFVARDVYEARQAALIAKDSQQESDLKALEADTQTQMQRVHERLESGKAQFEDRFKQQQEAQLSKEDRAWIRWSQIGGAAAVIISLLALLFEIAQHLRFQ